MEDTNLEMEIIDVFYATTNALHVNMIKITVHCVKYQLQLIDQSYLIVCVIKQVILKLLE